MSPFIQLEDLHDKLSTGLITADYIFKIPTLLGEGTALIWKKTVISQVEKHLREIKRLEQKSPNPRLQHKIKKLEAWLKNENKNIKQNIKDYAIKTVEALPSMVKFTIEIFTKIGTALGTMLSIASGVVSTAVHGYKFVKASETLKTQDKWIDKFQKKPAGVKYLNKMAQESKPKLDAYVKESHHELSRLVTGLINSKASYETIIDELEKRRIFIQKADPKGEIHDVDSLKDKLKTIDFSNAILTQYLEYKASVREIEALLAKRKKAYEQRLEKSEPEFMKWVQGVLNTTTDWEETKKALKEKGVSLEGLENGESIVDSKELSKRIRDPKTKQALIKQYVDYQDTIPITTRNALQTLAMKKQNIERSFNKFGQINAGAKFGLAALTATTMIVLKVLAITGAVAIPAIALSLTGVGAIAAGILLGLVGLYMFYRYKPNTFKSFFQGVHARLIMFRIPLAIQEFRMEFKKYNQITNSLKVAEITAKAIELEGLLNQTAPLEWNKVPETLKPLLKKIQNGASVKLSDSKTFEAADKIKIQRALSHEMNNLQKEQSQINEDVRNLEKSIAYWSEKVSPLKARLEAASLADFLEKARVDQKDVDFTETIAKGLVTDEAMLDDETRHILKEQMGINLDKLHQKFPDKENLRQEIQKGLIKFYTMDDSDLNNFIEKQKEKLRMRRAEG